MIEHLKPCPFCGTEPQEEWSGGRQILCEACGVGTSVEDTPEKALAVWNRRVPDLALSAEVERLRNEADGEFVAAAVRVMRATPSFDHRDYQDGITADDFEMFFTEDMNEAWRLHEKERARAEAAEARVAELRDLLLLVRPLLSWAPPGAGGAECMFTIDAALSHTKED